MQIFLSVFLGIFLLLGQDLCAATNVRPVFFHLTMPQTHEKIRGARWTPPFSTTPQITLVFLQGRGSFIEKNEESMVDFARMGFRVTTFDWPGQGGSTRPIPGSQKGHIDDFDTYLKALDYFLIQEVQPKAKGPIVLLGASMGGEIALTYAKEYPKKVDGVILAAPMLDVKTAPYPPKFARFMSHALSSLGASRLYAFGYGDYDPKTRSFEKNKETQDPVRYKHNQDLMGRFPQFVTGGPTFGWVSAAFKAMDHLQVPGYLEAIQTPILLASASLDQIVDPRKDQQMCARMPHCTHKLYPHAFHNLLLEKDVIRNDFLHQIDTFSRNLSKTTP